MIILPNGVAAIDGDTCHLPWVREEGLVHDRFMAKVIFNLIEGSNIRVAIDAGANIGTLTRVMLDAGAEVHAFEPNPDAVECLRHNCPQARVYECGLSDRAEKRILERLSNAGASFIAQHDQPSVADVQVQLMRLDTYAIAPGFIKLDVEGYEVNAILGAAQMIARHKPIILAEVNQGALSRAYSSPEALWGILQGFGYKVSIVQPDCVMSSPQYDILARP